MTLFLTTIFYYKYVVKGLIVMKKSNLIPIILSLAIGIYLGNIIYTSYKNNLKLEESFNEDNVAYILQQGVYSSKDSMNENTKNLTDYIYVLDNNKYVVFVCITSNMDNANKIKTIYNDKGIDIYIKDINISDSAFYEKLKEYDKMISNNSDNNEILNIEEQVLKEYELLMSE